MKDLAIRHDAGETQFTARVDGQEAELDYRIEGGVLTILHTGVPPAIEGRGIAAALVQAAFDHARAQGLKVRTACAYSQAWLGKHPEYEDLRA
ncbi:N-acetyltransferase [Lysobacter helvus]|uniref:N-acetyltransferase n=2 Tax=Lysobacteraceae TaxID=32033 RepID=A0ABN6FYM9_9GAMM|nr:MULTISPECIES: GNAT family N-acetyltransferase [Lysobacter]BCT94079.1 N-acetyltransferase [Lysobacter caseinilyticus]BCT97235.1 N-acetyltransferase [Lysobacter helvus]